MISKASGKGVMEPRFNEPLYKEDFGITNDILHASNSKIHGKRTSIQQSLVIANIFCQSRGPSLHRGTTVVGLKCL